MARAPSPPATRQSAGLREFAGLRVAVAGDLIADLWLHARPARLSREAPVLVLRHEREELGCGGAANVAVNLRALGASVAVFGAVARDAAGRELVAALEAERADVRGVATVSGWTTPAKTRVLAAEPRRNPQQVLRIDREPSAPLDAGARAAAAEALRVRAHEFDAVLVSDYEYGAVGPELADVCRTLVARGVACVLDPRRSIETFRGALTALTPNVGELAQFARVEPDALAPEAALARAARELVRRIAPRWLLVTRGNLGMALFGQDVPEGGAWVGASGDGAVTDVCGAGDTAAAAFTLALAAGCAPEEALRSANAAAGVVVMEPGTATCSPSALRAALARAPAPRAASAEEGPAAELEGTTHGA